MPLPPHPAQSATFRSALEALQVRLDTLPHEDWASVQEEVAAAKALASALQRDLPPEEDAGAGGGAASQPGSRPLPAAVVDDSSTTGVPAAGLQLVAVPSAEAATAAQPQPN